MAQIAPEMPSAPKMAPTATASCSAAKWVGRTWRFSHKGLDATRVALVPASFSDRGAQRSLHPSTASRCAGARMRCSHATIAVLRPRTRGPETADSRPWLGCRPDDNQKPHKTVSVACQRFRREITGPGLQRAVLSMQHRAVALYQIKYAVPARAAFCLVGAVKASKPPRNCLPSTSQPQATQNGVVDDSRWQSCQLSSSFVQRTFLVISINRTRRRILSLRGPGAIERLERRCRFARFGQFACAALDWRAWHDFRGDSRRWTVQRGD